MTARRPRHAQSSRPTPSQIRHQGVTYPVAGRIVIRHRPYLILRRLSGGLHPRQLVYDRTSGGELRTLLRLPGDSSAAQHMRVLRRIPRPSDLPQIVDVQSQDDELLVVLTWVRGIDLAEYFARIERGKVAAPCPFEAIRLIRGLAHDLRTLHQHAQVMHGDLKPQNLILTRRPARLVMIDFGSSWPLEQTMSRAPGDGVSPLYAGPEVLREPSGPLIHADQFSATVLLYELLTGERPYAGLGGKAGTERFREAMQDRLVPPSQISPQRPRISRRHWRNIDEVVATGLALDPQQRFPTTSAWLEALESIYLDLKLARRNRPLATPWWRRLLGGR